MQISSLEDDRRHNRNEELFTQSEEVESSTESENDSEFRLKIMKKFSSYLGILTSLLLIEIILITKMMFDQRTLYRSRLILIWYLIQASKSINYALGIFIYRCKHNPRAQKIFLLGNLVFIGIESIRLFLKSLMAWKCPEYILAYLFFVISYFVMPVYTLSQGREFLETLKRIP